MDTFGRFYQGQPSGTGAQLLYTVPANFAAMVKDIEVINIGDDDGEFMLWIVGPSDTLDDEWIVRPATTVVAGGSAEWQGSRTLEEGVEIWGECVGGPLNMIITGMGVDLTANA